MPIIEILCWDFWAYILPSTERSSSRVIKGWKLKIDEILTTQYEILYQYFWYFGLLYCEMALIMQSPFYFSQPYGLLNFISGGKKIILCQLFSDSSENKILKIQINISWNDLKAPCTLEFSYAYLFWFHITKSYHLSTFYITLNDFELTPICL